jgi:hypothetical protein
MHNRQEDFEHKNLFTGSIYEEINKSELKIQGSKLARLCGDSGPH